jgi:hypothetical protein
VEEREKKKNAQFKIGCSGFTVTQAYAMTIHKSQGLTLKPLVIDIAKRKGQRGGTNMTWEQLYVAMSRAPSDALLRVLPLTAEQSVDYLFKMTPDKDTLEYLDDARWRDGIRQYGNATRGRQQNNNNNNAAAAAAAAPQRNNNRKK